MAPTWTTLKSYDYSKRALEAWVRWRFAWAISEGADVRIRVKDGDYNVYAPEELDTRDKRALKRALKGREDWDPPAYTWEEFCQGL